VAVRCFFEPMCHIVVELLLKFKCMKQVRLLLCWCNSSSPPPPPSSSSSPSLPSSPRLALPLSRTLHFSFAYMTCYHTSAKRAFLHSEDLIHFPVLFASRPFSSCNAPPSPCTYYITHTTTTTAPPPPPQHHPPPLHAGGSHPCSWV
jgi:hypothetical protein